MATELTWLGHATWLIVTPEARIVLDPFLDEAPAAACKAADVAADFVLVSHGHFDHVADAAKIARRNHATVIANFEICEWLSKRGAKRIHPMNIGGRCAQPFGAVRMTIAHHSSTMPNGASGGSAAGFVLELTDGKVYFACDTGLFLDMRLIGEIGLDLAVLPIGDNFTMGPQDSLKALELLRPRKVIPVHYGTWPLIEQNAEAWSQAVLRQTDAEPVVLGVGETFELKRPCVPEQAPEEAAS